MSEELISLRTTQETAYRALSLGALVFRGTLDQAEAFDPGSRQHERAIVNLTWWLVKQNVLKHQTEWEKACFRKALGTMTPALIGEAVWRVESLAVLLWALRFIPEIPPYNGLTQVESILEIIPIFQLVTHFIESASLRDQEDILYERDKADLWQWRGWLEREKRAGKEGVDGEPISELIRYAAIALGESGFGVPIDGDFPVRGRAYRDANEKELTWLVGIANTRMSALDWLCGLQPVWDSPESQA